MLGVGIWGGQDAQAPDPASRSAAVEPAPPTVDEELIFLGRLPDSQPLEMLAPPYEKEAMAGSEMGAALL